MKTNRILSTVAAAFLATIAFSNVQAQSTMRSLGLGPQTPLPATQGSLAYYDITVTRAGGGSLDVYLSTVGLPANSSISFVPPKVVFGAGGPSTKHATMVVRVASGTPQGTYPFTLKARHGNSQTVLSKDQQLVISGNTVVVLPPVLYPPVPQTDGNMGLSGTGTALQPVLIQATTNLASALSWETIAVQSFDVNGFLALVDQDSTNFPARFYRLAQ